MDFPIQNSDLPSHCAKTCEATEFSAACAQQSDYYAGSTSKCQGLTRGKCLGYSEDHIDHPTWQGNQGRVAGTTVHLLKCPIKPMETRRFSIALTTRMDWILVWKTCHLEVYNRISGRSAESLGALMEGTRLHTINCRLSGLNTVEPGSMATIQNGVDPYNPRYS